MAIGSLGDARPTFESQTGPEEIGEEEKKKISPFDSHFARLVEATLAKWHLPGVAFAVVDGDQTFAEVFTLIKLV
jgi:hypothetical protein